MTKGERVKKIRIDEGLTLEKFGERLGVTSSTVSRVENGVHELTDQMFMAICREYGINKEWLRSGKGSMKRSPDEFSLDEYARKQGATEEEIMIAKAYFSVEPEIRKKFMDQLRASIADQRDDAAGSAEPVVPDKPLQEMTDEEIHEKFSEMEKEAIKEKRRESHQSDIIDSKRA